MKLLFIQGGSRWKYDEKGNVYTDANFNEKIWDRYRELCDDLTVVLKTEDRVYSEKIASERYNRYDTLKSDYVALKDIYKPVSRYLNIKNRRQIKLIIEDEIKKADAIIIRSIGTFYTNTALRCARKYNKAYLVEETGFSFEALWYHSILGKVAAIPNEIVTKNLMKDVPWAVYVTNETLQKRYPCNGQFIGCSDVEVEIDEKILLKRLNRPTSGKVVFGTAAFLDVGWKGQKYVIRAISRLKKQGINNIEYQLIGAGNGDALRNEIEKYCLQNEIKIVGALPHDKVFLWLDQIDVYIQTSFMEGLCRSIIEAMSRACPVICTDVGGNHELVSKECLVQKGNVREIENNMRLFLDPEIRSKYGRLNFEEAKKYEKGVLDNKRDLFYHKFLSTV